MSTLSHRRNFGEHPLAWLAASFAAGVLLSSLTPVRVNLFLTLAALASFAALVSTLKRCTYTSHLILAAFALAGASLASLEARDARADSRLRTLYERGEIEPGEPVELTCVLERAPEYAPGGLLFDVRAERVRSRGVERECAGRVEFFAPVADARAAALYDSLELRRGARVRVASLLMREESFRNPGVTSSDEFLARRDLDARATRAALGRDLLRGDLRRRQGRGLRQPSRALARDGRALPRGRHVPRARHQRPSHHFHRRSRVGLRAQAHAEARVAVGRVGRVRVGLHGGGRGGGFRRARVFDVHGRGARARARPTFERGQRHGRRGARAARPAAVEPLRPFVPAHVPLRRRDSRARAPPALGAQGRGRVASDACHALPARVPALVPDARRSAPLARATLARRDVTLDALL